MNWGRPAFEDEPHALCFADDWLDELEQMDPAEREAVLGELQARPDLWPEEGYAYA